MGYCISKNVELGVKVIPKTCPEEKLGIMLKSSRDGSFKEEPLIAYSDDEYIHGSQPHSQHSSYDDGSEMIMEIAKEDYQKRHGSSLSSDSTYSYPLSPTRSIEPDHIHVIEYNLFDYRDKCLRTKSGMVIAASITILAELRYKYGYAGMIYYSIDFLARMIPDHMPTMYVS